MRTHSLFLFVLPVLSCGVSVAQQPAPPVMPVASVQTEGVSLHGAMSVANGRAQIGNNGDITAGDRTAAVDLTRGGTLQICASTTVHIAKDAAAHGDSVKPDEAGLMFSVDRGAFETNYRPSAYSDVVMTPDLRMLISPPGLAHLKVRVNLQGDTCVDNAGADAPYVTVSSLAEGGVYRVRPGQRVLFVKGSLQEVVDNEHEPCGCPPATEPMASNGKVAGGPSSKPEDTAFPTAVSEGLQAPPAASATPVVPAGEAHAQVTASLSSNTPPEAPPAAGAEAAATSAAAAPSTPPPATTPGKKQGLFHSIGHFFSKVFGGS